MPVRPREAVGPAVRCLIGVVVAVALLDGAVFRDHLHPAYEMAGSAPRVSRVAQSALLAVIEEIKTRLVLMTLLVWLLDRLLKGSSSAHIVLAIGLAQLISVAPLIAADPGYVLCRYWAIGCVWGWLYWRHGWVTAAAPHAATHVVLDPLLWLMLTG